MSVQLTKAIKMSRGVSLSGVWVLNQKEKEKKEKTRTREQINTAPGPIFFQSQLTLKHVCG